MRALAKLKKNLTAEDIKALEKEKIKLIFKSDVSNLIGLETKKENIEVLEKIKGVYGIKISDKGTLLKTISSN